MNEQSLNVLEQYDFKVYKTLRARGGFLCMTSEGAKLLSECIKPDSYYEREHNLTAQLKTQGRFFVDTYALNKNGESLSRLEERKYYVKNWTAGRECNTDSLAEVEKAAQLMAHMHLALKNLAEKPCSEENFRQVFAKRTRELKSIGNYLKNKNKKNQFELLLYKNFHHFFEEASASAERARHFHAEADVREICHGSYNYHNVLVDGREMLISNFDRAKCEFQMADLYQFMRKLLEKHDWDLKLAYAILEKYDRVKRITATEREALACFFLYPEKFWKIANYYYNSNKAWMPQKNIQKLENVVRQNDMRQKFVDTFA